jgi:hypothetical protein
MKGSNLGKVSIGFLVSAWTFNAIGIDTKTMSILVIGLCSAVMAIIIGAIGSAKDKECQLSPIGLGIGSVVSIAWIAMHFVGWETFFE